ncbi:MAG: imidazolonepropionase [Acidobacteria bacterium]|nr:imidazolonepropionase [Acidobacteriota bacterium]
MPKYLLIRGARQLLTLRGPAPRRGRQLSELGLIQDGAVLVADDKIHSVGASRRMENLKEARLAEEIDATGKVVMPGFVDSHTHFVFPAPRLDDFERRIAGDSYLETGRKGGGIHATVQALRQTSPRGLESRGLRWLKMFAACGTTTVEGKSGYGLSPASERKTLRVMKRLNGRPLEVVRTFLGAHLPPPEYADLPEEYVTLVTDQMLPEIRRQRLAEFCDVFCDTGAFTLAQSRRILEVARALGLGLKVHADQLSRLGATRLAVELGAVSADHLEQAAEEDLDGLAASGTIATLLPGSVYHLGSGRFAPARQLIERGAAVALATDFNPGTSPTLNMQMILSLASTQMKMTPAEGITAATINGAAALRRANQTGSLEPGKFADLAIFDAGDYREIAYYFGMNLCRLTMRRGKVIWPEIGAKVEEET